MKKTRNFEHLAHQEKPIYDSSNTIDKSKLFFILRTTSIWIITIFIVFISISYSVVRWTKPLYEAETTIQIETKRSPVNILENDPVESIKLSGEIAIISSTVMFDTVIEVLNLGVSYHYEGDILNDERFGNSPFEVKYKIHNAVVYDKKFSVKILDKEKFILSYQFNSNGYDNEEYKMLHRFGEVISTNSLEISLYPTAYGNTANLVGNYHFFIHSKEYLKEYIEANLTVVVENLSANTINISFIDANRNKAIQILRAINANYAEKSVENKNRKYENSLKYLQNQRKLTRDTISFLEEKINLFPKEIQYTNSKDYNSSGYHSIFNSIEATKEKQVELLSELQTYNKIRDSVRKLSDSVPIEMAHAISATSFIQAMAMAIGDASLLNLTSLLIKAQENSIRLKGSYKNSTSSSQQVLSRENRIKQQIRQLLEIRIKLLKKKLGGLKEKIVKLNSTLKENNSDPEFEKLISLTRRYRNYFDLITSKAIEINITKHGTVQDFQVISPPHVSTVPIRPIPSLIYGIGVSLAFIMSIGLVLVKYVMQNKISSPRELEIRLNAALIGVIPEYNKEKMQFSQLVVNKNPKAVISEAMRSVRTNLDFLNSKNDKQIISVTSTISGEGKTFIALNIGGIIAFSDVKVIILDLDMRKPKVHLGLNAQNTVGISNLLVGKNKLEDCIQKTSEKNLDFITAGAIAPNPSELIISEAFDKLLEQLKEKYDKIILDTPPVGLVTDGIIAMQKADTPLYVMRAKFSKLAFAANVNKIKKVYQFNNIGVILNAVNSQNSYGHSYDDYGYNYGYAVYAHKNHKDYNSAEYYHLDEEIEKKSLLSNWWQRLKEKI